MYTIFTIFYQFVNKILTAAHTNANIFLEVGNMGFNENLRLLLIQKEMKQADLCRMTGIQTSLMSEYISGRKSPTIRNAILIADAFDISLDTLVGRAGPLFKTRRSCIWDTAERIHGRIVGKRIYLCAGCDKGHAPAP